MEDTDSKNVTPAPAWLKVLLDAVIKPLVWFGVLSRALFIPLFAIIAYQLIDPRDVIDVPFSRLTIGMIFENLLAWSIVVFCVVWFFRFPKKDDYWLIGYSESDKDRLQVRAVEDEYLKWSRYGVLVLIIIILIYWIK